MPDCLIGHTGFVGSNLSRQRSFDAEFNSRTFEQLQGRTFDCIVCAGLPAAKWKANRDPEADRANIEALQRVLRHVEVSEFILISTIDVYPVLEARDESYDCHRLPNHAYGENRLAFEDFIQETFSQVTIVRLPALFGPGLKKNLIYDLMNDNLIHSINVESRFQWYSIRHLWPHIERCRANGVQLINLFTEPVRTGVIIKNFFTQYRDVGKHASPEVSYDLKTRHSQLFGRDDGYIGSAEETLVELGDFLSSEPNHR